MVAILGSSLPAPADATTAETAAETTTTTTTTITTTTTVAATTTTAVAAATTTTVTAATAATAEAAAAVTTVATAVAAPVQDDPKDPVDTIIASALEGINLALSMDNPLDFSAMSPVSREPEIQGEPPQVIPLSSPLN